MIDIESGSIFIEDKNTLLKPGLSEDEFKKTMLFSDVLDEDIDIYSNYYVKPQNIYDNKFIMRIYFNEKRHIEFIQLSLVIDNKIPSWDNWSKAEEINKKNLHDDCLQKNLGNPPYIYSWGEIISRYDMRSGSSGITIRYYNY